MHSFFSDLYQPVNNPENDDFDDLDETDNDSIQPMIRKIPISIAQHTPVFLQNKKKKPSPNHIPNKNNKSSLPPPQKKSFDDLWKENREQYTHTFWPTRAFKALYQQDPKKMTKRVIEKVFPQTDGNWLTSLFNKNSCDYKLTPENISYSKNKVKHTFQILEYKYTPHH